MGCAGNGCSHHAGEPAEDGYDHTKGCSYECNDCGPNKNQNGGGQGNQNGGGPNPWACMTLQSEHVGMPAPFNATMYSSDGSTVYGKVMQGQLATSEIVGNLLCPCHIIPGGTTAPVAGVWEGSMPVSAGAISPHQGEFCVSPDSRMMSNFTQKNMCLNPSDFDPMAVNGTCSGIMTACASVEQYGGFAPPFLNSMMTIIPQCCSGNSGYNQNSGCGQMNVVDNDYCDGGDFDNDGVAYIDCTVPNGDAESCTTEECRSSEIACLAARGKPLPWDSSKSYSMDLQPISRRCSEVYGQMCARAGAGSLACMFKNDEGDMEPCLDAECYKSHDACMSRAGTMRFDGRMYPAQMEYNPSGTGSTGSTENQRHLEGMVWELTRRSSKCCKTGGYKDACLTPQQKDAAYKYHTCANPSQFDPTRINVMSGERSCSEHDIQFCGKQARAEGMCSDPQDPNDDGWAATQEECSHNPGKVLRPFTHADRVFQASFEIQGNADSCCLDKQLSEGCKNIAKDSYLQTPPSYFQSCRDMTKFQSNLRLPYIGNMTCGQVSRYGLYAHIFHKGECVDANGEEGCGGHGCRASKTVCESKGFTFKPLTQSMVDNVPTSHMSTCCGGSSNVKSPLSLTQYVKDGFVDSAPAPGACVKSSCCGEGTVWQEGAGCIPTRSGMIDACKANVENGHGHAMRKSFAHPDSIARILIVATNGCTGMSMFDAYSQHLPGIVPYQPLVCALRSAINKNFHLHQHSQQSSHHR